METGDNTVGSRLKFYLEQENIAEAEAAERLDMRVAQLKRMLEGKAFRLHWMLRIEEAFPTLNSRWLVSGQGDMRMQERLIPTEMEKQEVELLDEARILRDRVHNLPAKRQAELCAQVIEVAERLYHDNQDRRKRLLIIRKHMGELQTTMAEHKDITGFDPELNGFY